MFANTFVWVYHRRRCDNLSPHPPPDGFGITLEVEWAGPDHASSYSIFPVDCLSAADIYETPLHALARFGDAGEIAKAIGRGWTYALEVPNSVKTLTREELLDFSARTVKRVSFDADGRTHGDSGSTAMDVALFAHHPPSCELIEALKLRKGAGGGRSGTAHTACHITG